MADNQTDALGSHIDKCQLIRPQDSGYDEARSVFYGRI